MGIGVSYLAIALDNSDEAESLANYLNEHGVCAFKQTINEVNCPIENSDTLDLIEKLKDTWRMFWDYSDSGLFGLQVYTKDS